MLSELKNRYSTEKLDVLLQCVYFIHEIGANAINPVSGFDRLLQLNHLSVAQHMFRVPFTTLTLALIDSAEKPYESFFMQPSHDWHEILTGEFDVIATRHLKSKKQSEHKAFYEQIKMLPEALQVYLSQKWEQREADSPCIHAQYAKDGDHLEHALTARELYMDGSKAADEFFNYTDLGYWKTDVGKALFQEIKRINTHDWVYNFHKMNAGEPYIRWDTNPLRAQLLFLCELRLLKTRRINGFDRFIPHHNYTIADHSTRSQAIAMILCALEEIEFEKTLLMTMIAPFPKTRITEISHSCQKFVDGYDDAKLKHFEDQLHMFPNSIATQFQDLYTERNKRETTEAQCSKDASLLEYIFTAKEAYDQGITGLSHWLTKSDYLHTQSAKDVLTLMMSIKSYDIFHLRDK